MNNATSLGVAGMNNATNLGVAGVNTLGNVIGNTTQSQNSNIPNAMWYNNLTNKQ